MLFHSVSLLLIGNIIKYGATHTRIQLVDAADPPQAGFGDIVQGHQIEVAGHTMDGADANLM